MSQAGPGHHTEGKPTVLVVDDDAAVRTLLDVGLRHHGFTVLPAASGAEAVEQWRRQPDAVAVVLLDVQMPGMDGPQTLRALRALAPDLPCCFMTGNPGRYLEQDLVALGVVHVFAKPFPLAEAAERLRQLTGPAERRAAPRRTEPDVPLAIREGPDAQVRDRSPGGLGLWAAAPLAVGAVVAVRPAAAPEAAPWVEVEVKHCRRCDQGWAVGGQFVRPSAAGPFEP